MHETLYCVYLKKFFGFSVGKQKRYATSRHVYLTSYANICNIKREGNRHVSLIVN